MQRLNGPATIRTTLAMGSLIALATLVSGCAFFSSSGSISDSSGSISDSVGSSSDSSTSSSDNDSSAAYRREIRTYTRSLASAGGTPETLRRGVSEIALGIGISDWEGLDITWRAVGQGLKDADLSEGESLAYRSALAPAGSLGDQLMRAGYPATLL